MSIRLSKIYTRTGDTGTTALLGGQRIPKTSLQLEAYGTVDELNSVIGILRTHARQLPNLSSAVAVESAESLRYLQNRLFDLGSILATPFDSPGGNMPIIGEEDVRWLEEKMDRYNEVLEALPSFVLPGGGVLNAYAHLARTVCRRLERILWHLQEETQAVPAIVLMYVNRLSDYLFVYSRWAAHELHESEFLWEHPLREP
jgi:cob(I)alamin adenosyltransferase